MSRSCSFEGCGRPHLAQGYCSGHYSQKRRGYELQPIRRWSTAAERFWAKVNKSTAYECWGWAASLSPHGYGRFGYEGKVEAAHRVAWEMTNGPIPDGMFLDHRCANPSCVNPEHLRVVTVSENLQHRTGPTRKSSSGVRGVHWDKRRDKWCVKVQLNGRQYWGGYHPTLEAADAAAKALRAELHTHDDYGKWVKEQEARQ